MREAERRVGRAQSAMLHQRIQMSTLTGVAFGGIICLGLLPYVDHITVWMWFTLRCVVSAARLILSNRIARATAVPDGEVAHTPNLDRLFLAVLAADGLVWGLLCMWLAPRSNPQVVALLLTSIAGVSAVGMFVLQASWRASASLLTMMILPVVVHQLAERTRFGVYTGVGFGIFLAIILLEARRCEARILELLRLRFSTDRIAEERAEALRMAERQSRVKSQFLATMSHEMRTPLHGILGVTRMMQEAGAVPAAEQLALVEQAGEHLLRLINDALDVSKLEGGHLRLTPKPFDLEHLIEDVISLSQPVAKEAGLVLRGRLRLPRPCRVHGDAARVRQILHNLVGNALKFTEQGTVTVVATYRPGRARIAVYDTGPGIAPEELPRIFDAFHQADGSFSRRYGGTGLGLSIARELAHAMGGDLVCTSVVGRGSRFTVTLALPGAPAPSPRSEAPTRRQGAVRPGAMILARRISSSTMKKVTVPSSAPRSVSAAPASSPEPSSRPAPTSTPEPSSSPAPLSSNPVPPPADLAQRQVLLAEDNPVNALVAQASLKKLGLSVRLVVNGAEAVAAFQERQPDMVLLDCQMPVMDGFEAARRMRQHERDAGWGRTPVLALSANALESDRERSLASGMDEHLAKPFRVEELRVVLERLMREAPKVLNREETKA
jgi:two-component system, sensor histidine kinase